MPSWLQDASAEVKAVDELRLDSDDEDDDPQMDDHRIGSLLGRNVPLRRQRLLHREDLEFVADKCRVEAILNALRHLEAVDNAHLCGLREVAFETSDTAVPRVLNVTEDQEVHLRLCLTIPEVTVDVLKQCQAVVQVGLHLYRLLALRNYIKRGMREAYEHVLQHLRSNPLLPVRFQGTQYITGDTESPEGEEEHGKCKDGDAGSALSVTDMDIFKTRPSEKGGSTAADITDDHMGFIVEHSRRSSIVGFLHSLQSVKGGLQWLREVPMEALMRSFVDGVLDPGVGLNAANADHGTLRSAIQHAIRAGNMCEDTLRQCKAIARFGPHAYRLMVLQNYIEKNMSERVEHVLCHLSSMPWVPLALWESWR